MSALTIIVIHIDSNVNPTFHLQREYIKTQYRQQTLEFYRRAYTYVHNQSLAHKCFEPVIAYN